MRADISDNRTGIIQRIDLTRRAGGINGKDIGRGLHDPRCAIGELRRGGGAINHKIIKGNRAIAAGLNAPAIGKAGFIAAPSAERITPGHNFNHAIIHNRDFIRHAGQRHRIAGMGANRAARIIIEVKLMAADVGKGDSRRAGGGANCAAIVKIHLLIHIEK